MKNMGGAAAGGIDSGQMKEQMKRRWGGDFVFGNSQQQASNQSIHGTIGRSVVEKKWIEMGTS